MAEEKKKASLSKAKEASKKDEAVSNQFKTVK